MLSLLQKKRSKDGGQDFPNILLGPPFSRVIQPVRACFIQEVLGVKGTLHKKAHLLVICVIRSVGTLHDCSLFQ